jgi:hypothetical protein
MRSAYVMSYLNCGFIFIMSITLPLNVPHTKQLIEKCLLNFIISLSKINFHENLTSNRENGLLSSLCLFLLSSVCESAWNKSSVSGGVFMEIIWSSFGRSVEKIQQLLKILTKISGHLYLNPCTFMIKHHSIIIKIITFIDNIADVFTTHILYSVTFS